MFSFVGNLKKFIMESKELRIGNYVNHKELGYVQVYGMNLEVIQFDYRKEPYYDEIPFEKLSYVPLSEEILLKCGFEWSIQHQSYKHKNFKYVIDFYNSHPQFNSSVCFLNKEHRSGENLICIHYLHQLQNLYFALTNTELTVNL